MGIARGRMVSRGNRMKCCGMERLFESRARAYAAPRFWSIPRWPTNAGEYREAPRASPKRCENDAVRKRPGLTDGEAPARRAAVMQQLSRPQPALPPRR